MFPINDQFANFFKNFETATAQFANVFNMMPMGNEQVSSHDQNSRLGNNQLINSASSIQAAQALFLTTLASKAFEITEKIVALNMSAANAYREESLNIASQVIASNSPQEFLALVAALPQQTTSNAVEYGRQLAAIAAELQGDLARANEQQPFSEMGRQFSALFDNGARYTRTGSN